MSRAERARQFMPFAALRGFEKLIEAQSKEISPKRELSEEQAARLSAKLLRLQRGVMVEVIYYAEDGYVTQRGLVSDIDIPMRTLTVVKKKISFEDLLDIRMETIEKEDRQA